MCAGAAVYSALHSGNIAWHSRVEVLGIGGLGHLAIQFAAKMGCEVIALSHSASKEEDARSLGASEFHTLSNIDTATFRPLDCLLLAGAAQPDWSQIVLLVRRGGSIMAMTVDMSEVKIPYMLLVMNAIAIKGSLPTPPRLHREMLAFAAFHKIRPVVQTFPFTEDGINDALELLRNGKIKYRAVVQRA
jgi:D-arabinose 1-dehydrogenase-like Zn-dependent alcohol dehydrogenase